MTSSPILRARKFVRDVQLQRAILHFRAHIFHLSSDGSIARLHGNHQLQLLWPQELNRIQLAVDRGADENSYETIGEWVYTLKIYAFNVQATIERLCSLIERKLNGSLRPPFK